MPVSLLGEGVASLTIVASIRLSARGEVETARAKLRITKVVVAKWKNITG
jgi:hypothetical protein